MLAQIIASFSATHNYLLTYILSGESVTVAHIFVDFSLCIEKYYDGGEFFRVLE